MNDETENPIGTGPDQDDEDWEAFVDDLRAKLPTEGSHWFYLFTVDLDQETAARLLDEDDLMDAYTAGELIDTALDALDDLGADEFTERWNEDTLDDWQWAVLVADDRVAPHLGVRNDAASDEMPPGPQDSADAPTVDADQDEGGGRDEGEPQDALSRLRSLLATKDPEAFYFWWRNYVLEPHERMALARMPDLEAAYHDARFLAETRGFLRSYGQRSLIEGKPWAEFTLHEQRLITSDRELASAYDLHPWVKPALR